MAILMVMRWASVTPEAYEEVRSAVDWEHDQPPGGLFHVAAFDDAGLRVTDVWDSAEDFQRFVDNRLMPAIQELGTIQGEPEVEILPVHAVYSPVLEHAIV